jgi:hypothetical protein
MLTRMIDRGHGGVREEGIVYGNESENVNDENTGQPDGCGHGGVREEGIVYGNENVNDEDTGQPDG